MVTESIFINSEKSPQNRSIKEKQAYRKGGEVQQ
jgi:hypothetical protein